MTHRQEADQHRRYDHWTTADHDVVAAVEKIAMETGASVQAVINEVDRRGLGMEPTDKDLRQVIQNFSTTNNITTDNRKTTIRGDSHFSPVLNILSNIRAKLRLYLRLKDDEGHWNFATIAFVVIGISALVVFRCVGL